MTQLTVDSRKVKGRKNSFTEWLHSPSCKCALLLLGTFLILLALFFFICAPRKYDLRVGSISLVTVVAPKDVVDEVTTEAHKAGDKEVYRFDMAPINSNEFYGNDWHPNIYQDEKMANELTPYLRKLMNWF